MENKRKGFLDLANLLRKFKGPVTYKDVILEVCKEGWVSDFNRLGSNTVTRQINNHNEKYGGPIYAYTDPFGNECQ